MIYFGEVLDIDDPQKSGRVKVSVFGVHQSTGGVIPTSELPWSIVLLPNTSASFQGVGHSHGLLVGSHVTGVFIDKLKQHFLVVGTYNSIDGDVPTPALTNYPNNRVVVTKSGHSLQFNDETGDVILSQSGGSNITFKSDGSVNIKSEGDFNSDAEGSKNDKVSGDSNLQAGGSITQSASGVHNISSNSLIRISAPRVEIGNFGGTNLKLKDLNSVSITGLRTDVKQSSSSYISSKSEIIQDYMPEGNVCSIETPENLYDSVISIGMNEFEYNNETIDAYFQIMGFEEGTYKGDVYWGTVWLGYQLKIAGHRYLQGADLEKYFDYPTLEETPDLTIDNMSKGDVIILSRGSGTFCMVYSGVMDKEFNDIYGVIPDYDGMVVDDKITLDADIKIKKIFRPIGCNERPKVTWDKNCSLPSYIPKVPVNDDLLAMAMNIYFEARNQKQIFNGEQYPRGQVAVAWVVMNRLKAAKENSNYRMFHKKHRGRGLGPKTISGVVFAGMQFSWTNTGEGAATDWTPRSKNEWCLALEIAEKVINGELPDPTNIGGEVGATFYHNPTTSFPSWGKRSYYTSKGYTEMTIQDHKFLTPKSLRSPLL